MMTTTTNLKQIRLMRNIVLILSILDPALLAVVMAVTLPPAGTVALLVVLMIGLLMVALVLEDAIRRLEQE